jgi:hypothetical protein
MLRTILGCLIIWAALPPVVRAQLRFEETASNAGTVKTGAPLIHSFAFTNVGATGLEIIEARASCGCSKPRLEKRTFRPGEKGAATLEVNTLSQAPGPRSWSLQIKYRQGDAVADATLQLGARLVREVMVQPSALVVFAEHAAEHEIVVTDSRPEPLAIREVRLSTPSVRPAVSAPERTSDGLWTQRVKIVVGPDCPPGRHDDQLTIYTTDPQYPELTIPVTLLNGSADRFTAVPQELTFLGVAGKSLPARIALIRDNLNGKVVIKSANGDDPAIQCRWAAGPENLATLKVQINGKLFHEGELHSSVRVELSDPVSQTIAIPIHAILK